MNYSLETLLYALLAFRTDMHHPAEKQKCLEFVKQYFLDAGLQVKTFSSHKLPSLIAAKKLKKRYEYILNGHLDVVPADYEKAYEPTRKGTRIYARGAADMKGTVAAMMQLMLDLKKSDVDAAIMLTFDEELGGKNGVDYLVNQKGYTCECAIIPDGGNDFHLTLQQKGLFQVKVCMKGQASHGSRPWMGENAIDQIMHIYKRIKRNFPDTRDNHHWNTTVNLGKMNGGSAVNMVADEAEMHLDFRYIDLKEKKRIISLLNRITRENNNASYEILLDGSVMHVDPLDPYVKKIMSSAEQEGITLVPEKSHTASDARYFAENDIPVLMFNPICSKGHIDNEWIDIESLKDYYIVLKRFLNH